MSLRDDLNRIAADLSYREGSAVMRVGTVLAAKADDAGDYWRGFGRERFDRELLEDGLDTATVAEVIAVVDDTFTASDVSLDAILEDLRRRG